jgi:hypothetical protein
MKRKLHFLFSSLLLLSVSAGAQNYTYFTEYFDDGATAITGTTASAATTPTPATIKSGTWTTYYSFRAGSGCTPQDPAVSSAKQLRLLGTGATTPSGLQSNSNGPYSYLITPTLSNGVNVVSWKNLSTSTSGATKIYTSIDNGTTWNFFQEVSTLSTSCSDYSVTINNAAVNKIKFQNESTANQELDNITITSVTALPVTFSGVKVFAKEKGVQVEWTIATESNIKAYLVERSVNGREFSSVANVASKGNSSVSIGYSFFDATPVAGTNFYRIKAIDNDGSVKYSSIVDVNISRTKSDVTVAPNPIRNNNMNVQLSDIAKGTYSLKVFNNVGQVVFTSHISTEGGSLTKSFKLPVTAKAGVYTLQVAGNDLNITKKIVIE